MSKCACCHSVLFLSISRLVEMSELTYKNIERGACVNRCSWLNEASCVKPFVGLVRVQRGCIRGSTFTIWKSKSIFGHTCKKNTESLTGLFFFLIAVKQLALILPRERKLLCKAWFCHTLWRNKLILVKTL